MSAIFNEGGKVEYSIGDVTGVADVANMKFDTDVIPAEGISFDVGDYKVNLSIWNVVTFSEGQSISLTELNQKNHNKLSVKVFHGEEEKITVYLNLDLAKRIVKEHLSPSHKHEEL
ncbi:MAG: hypothetical protein O3A01_04120 [bacterium]|nr:hypothetical protein [bacterium]